MDQCRLWLVLASARALLRHEVLYFMIRGASSVVPYAAVCSKIMRKCNVKTHVLHGIVGITMGDCLTDVCSSSE